MIRNRKIHAKRGLWLKHYGFVLLLLVSLYSVSRPLYRARKANPAETLLAVPASLADNSQVNPSFVDNRGNIAWPAPARSIKKFRRKADTTNEPKY